jgi:hypothetical protein
VYPTVDVPTIGREVFGRCLGDRLGDLGRELVLKRAANVVGNSD